MTEAECTFQSFPPNLIGISQAYDDPPLFSDPKAKAAMDKIVLASLGRQGLWEAVDAFEEVNPVLFHLTLD